MPLSFTYSALCAKNLLILAPERVIVSVTTVGISLPVRVRFQSIRLTKGLAVAVIVL